MKKKGFLALIVGIILMFSSLVSTGCVTYEKPRDKTKVYVDVYNYNGGVGKTWLDAAATRFMEANKERQFESGKTGVIVEVHNTKDDPTATLKTRNESVFFLENVNYNALTAQGNFLEINDVLTSENPYEAGTTIESKLSENTKTALKGYDGNYYVLPHYQSYDGITYNKTVFDENNLYFALKERDYISSDSADVGYGFIKDSECEKSVGPNGIKGDYDDGLPSSIEELIKLCEYIKAKSMTPFVWYNGFVASYQQKLVNALWASLEGYDGALAQFNFDSNGTKTKIVTGFDADGNPETEEVAITESNAYKIYQQESRYHALRFAQYLFSNRNNYHPAATGSESHTDVQKEFMQDDVAMLIEGTYWRNEATDANTFRDYPALKNVETRFMPLPVQAYGQVKEGQGKEPVVIETHMSYAFINSNTLKKHGAESLAMAKEFLQFCYTDESLAEFTIKSSVTKDLDYTLGTVSDDYPNGEKYEQLSDYAKSVWDIKNNGKVINPISAHVLFIKNPTNFIMANTSIWQTTIAGSTKYPYDAFKASNTTKYTARQYFEGMSKTETWWNALSR